MSAPLNPEHLMRCMSFFVFQDVTLFNDTVFNNIRADNIDATEEQVMAAKAYCDEFIQRLPDGYQTIIERNNTLPVVSVSEFPCSRSAEDAPIISSGQRQPHLLTRRTGFDGGPSQNWWRSKTIVR